jgi:pimeloyl-ACP methyl ester carboxylesterase
VKLTRFIMLAAIATLSASAWAQTGQAACERLRSLHSGSSRILTADYSVAGEFRAPSVGSFSPPPIMLPAHCSVRVFTPASSDRGVTSEIWLPDPADWNGKLLGTGNGGYSNALSYHQMAEALQRGFAVGGSDTGHDGDGLAFGTGHPEKIRDWAYRSTHVLAEDAKTVIAALYGKGPTQAYFAGCSTGGQQALSEAQRYPQSDGPPRKADGTRMFPGWPRGSEAGWGSYFISPAKPVRLEFWSDWAFAEGAFDMRTFNAPVAVAKARAKFPYVEAIDPDLRAFQQRGGKLLIYHGWADAVVPPEDTIGYYERVKQSLGTETEVSVRLFMVPGMGHCAGGPGATTFDAVGALDQWVTGAMAPDSILAAHQSGGKSLLERPLCAYPKSAQWDGKSDPAKASSFRCMKDLTQ